MLTIHRLIGMSNRKYFAILQNYYDFTCLMLSFGLNISKQIFIKFVSVGLGITIQLVVRQHAPLRNVPGITATVPSNTIRA